MNPKRTTPRHIVMKMEKNKDKERLLKAAKEKQLAVYKGTLRKLSADVLAEAFQARKKWHDKFKVMKG